MKSLNGAAVVAAWGALAVGGIVNGQSIWTVCPDGSCDFTDVQAAVDASQSGDTILLHSGTYAPFQIVGKALTIEGTGDDVVIDGLHSSRVITIADATVSDGVVLRRLVIANGRVESSDAPVRGGGVLVTNSTTTLDNCTVRECEVVRPSGGFYDDSGGGGVAALASTLTITDCRLTGNSVATTNNNSLYASAEARGGGLFLRESVATLANCLVEGNSLFATTTGTSWHNVLTFGGGVAAVESDLIALDCEFTGNTLHSLNATSTVAACVAEGGGVLWDGGDVDVSVQLIRCRVSGNTLAVESSTTYSELYNRAEGGGVHLRRGVASGSLASIADCIIVGNSAQTTAPKGRALGGGLYCHRDTTVRHTAVLENAIALESSSGQMRGGGVTVENGAQITLDRSAICGNEVEPLYVLDGEVVDLETCLADDCPDCPDCDASGVIDLIELFESTLIDNDDNGVPDCCDASTACHVMEHVAELRQDWHLTNAIFGQAVFSGYSVLVSVREEDNAVTDDSDVVREYQLDPDGELQPTGRILVQDPSVPDVDDFGATIGLSGPWLVVGSESGEVHFFHREDDWFALHLTYTPDTSGSSIVVDVSAEWAVITRPDVEQVVMFSLADLSPEVHSILASDLRDGDLSGSELLLSRSDPGRAELYQFEAESDSWVFVVQLGSGLRYGAGCALDGNVAIVADRDASISGWASGGAYVYERSSPTDTSWDVTATLGPPTAPFENQETSAQLVRGQRVFALQAGNCEDSNADRSQLFSWRRQGEGWEFEQTHPPSDTGVRRFGISSVSKSAGSATTGGSLVMTYLESDSVSGCASFGNSPRRSVLVVWAESHDCNADGIADVQQILGGELVDLNGNGVPDCCDEGVDCNPSDCDNNGISDADEIAAGAADCDLNGVPDTCQDDSDGDGTVDECDLCPSDPLKTSPGACGCGLSDTDSDADGTPDCNDGCPSDPNKTSPGTCGCGVSDIDSDSDGTPDCNDGCPNDPDKTSPGTCGCGVADTDNDSDGTPDCNDGCPSDPNKTSPGACGCGVSDTDSDADGTPDCNDGCPSDPNKTSPGACGCGVSDADSDTDGTPDCNDGCPNDPSKVDAGICGCGVPESEVEVWYPDADGDGFGSVASGGYVSCVQPAGWVLDNTDCNDGDALINPGASEICNNSIDEDCSGSLTDCHPALVGFVGETSNIAVDSIRYGIVDVYAVFDPTVVEAVNIYNAVIFNVNGSPFVQDDLAGGSWLPTFTDPNVASADSFVTVGGEPGPASGNTTALDPSFGDATVEAPPSGAGWYNSNPGNLQGLADAATGRVHLGQFAVQQTLGVEALSFTGSVSFKASPDGVPQQAIATTTVTYPEIECPWDIDGDGEVSGSDIGLLLLQWDLQSSTADFDGDGTVGGEDIGLLLLNWGPCL